MNRQADQKARFPRHALYLPLLLIGICLLYGWATLSIRPSYDLSQNQTIPISINATKSADYSPDFYTPVGNVSLNILLDLFRDLDPAFVPEERMATLVGSLQTPVEWVTMPAGSTQVNPTVAATLHIETTVAETAITENPIVIIPATPIPPTSPPIPPPPPKPTKPPPEEPPPPAPTATYTPTPEPVHLDIIIPSIDGTVISNLSDTTFEAKAWDPAIGTNNGDGITSVSFTISNLLGTAIYSYTDNAAGYCVFKGDGPCKDAKKESVSLKADTYTIEATVLTAAGVTKMVTRTFVVPVITHFEIIIPVDGINPKNPSETKFEAEAWDTSVGLSNGDGITSITFTLEDTSTPPVIISGPTADNLAPFCVFGGSCDNITTLIDGKEYTLKADLLLQSGPPIITLTRTFTYNP